LRTAAASSVAPKADAQGKKKETTAAARIERPKPKSTVPPVLQVSSILLTTRALTNSTGPIPSLHEPLSRILAIHLMLIVSLHTVAPLCLMST
jgi:hypothetical protein